MIKVKVKNLSGVETYGAECNTQEEADSWINKCIDNNSFGKPERWVRENEEDIANSLETRESTTIDGTITEYKLASEYTIEQTDITAQVEQERINRESLQYLADTDWYVLRAQEDPTKPIPQDIKDLRASARLAIVR